LVSVSIGTNLDYKRSRDVHMKLSRRRGGGSAPCGG